MIRAATRQAAATQRSTYFALLRVHDFLVPADEEAAKASRDLVGRPAGAALEMVERVKRDAAEEADDMIARHTPALPDCERAAFHLQLASLAMGTQRALLRAWPHVEP